MKQLEGLNLSSNQITQLEPTIFNGLEQLEYLNLDSNQIESLKLSSDLISLDFLDVSNNNLTQIEIKQDKMPNLKTLKLFFNKLNSVNINSQSLKEIDISSYQLSNIDRLILVCPSVVFLKQTIIN